MYLNDTGNDNITADDLSLVVGKLFLPYTVVLGILIVIGFFGNALMVGVYSTQYKRCNFKFFVLTLCIGNLTFVFFVMTKEMYKQAHYFVFDKEWFCKLPAVFNIFSVFNTAGMLLVIAIDRFRKTYRPLSWQINPKVAIRLCILVSILALLSASPAAFEYVIQTKILEYNGVNVTVRQCTLNKEDKVLYNIGRVMYLVFSTLPMLPTVVLYVMIFVRFCRGMPGLNATKRYNPNKRTVKFGNGYTADKDDGSDNNSQFFLCCSKFTSKAKVKRKTFIMVLVTATYIIAMIINLGMSAAPKSKDYLKDLLSPSGAARRFISKLDFMNSILQPVLYGLLDQKFQDAIKAIFCCRKRRDGMLETMENDKTEVTSSEDRP